MATPVDPAPTPTAERIAVDAALDYAAYAADWTLASVGAEMWASKFPQACKGDALLGRKETEQRPDACMRILAAEVRRLRDELSDTHRRQHSDQAIFRGAFQLLKEAGIAPGSTELLAAADRFDAAAAS